MPINLAYIPKYLVLILDISNPRNVIHPAKSENINEDIIIFDDINDKPTPVIKLSILTVSAKTDSSHLLFMNMSFSLLISINI